MKTRFSVALAILIMLAVLNGCSHGNPYLKYISCYSKPAFNIKDSRLGVMPLECAVPSAGFVISDTISQNLLDSGCNIVERSYLIQIFKEHGLSLTSLTEELNYVRLGKISNIDYILVGTIHAPGGGTRTSPDFSGATIRIVNVTTGELVMSASCRATRRLMPILLGEAFANVIKKELWKKDSE